MNIDVERLLAIVGELEVTRRMLAARVAELEARLEAETERKDST